MKNSHNLRERLSVGGAVKHRVSEPGWRRAFLGLEEDFLRLGDDFLGLGEDFLGAGGSRGRSPAGVHSKEAAAAVEVVTCCVTDGVNKYIEMMGGEFLTTAERTYTY